MVVINTTQLNNNNTLNMVRSIERLIRCVKIQLFSSKNHSKKQIKMFNFAIQFSAFNEYSKYHRNQS